MTNIEFANFKAVPFEKLVKAGWNYNEDDEELTKKLIANIKRIGQVENILIRALNTGYYEVINGNHRYDVFEALGVKTVFCYDFGNISEAQAKRIAIETNETKWQANTTKLAEVMVEISAEFDISELELTMPYTEQEITDFTETLNFDWDAVEDAQGDGNSAQETELQKIKCPQCGHEFFNE